MRASVWKAMKKYTSHGGSPAITRSQARRQRRKQLRTQYLADLAQTNPEAFARRWNWLLEGWAREVTRRTPLLRENDGAWTPTAAALIADVQATLQSIDDRTAAAELHSTLQTLSAAQMQSLAKAVERRLAPKQWNNPT
jgi:hypothetical protein